MPKAAAYPIFLNLSRRPVLIVGGGAVAARKAQGLLEAGARVSVVSPTFGEALAKERAIRRIRAPYAPLHMRGKQWALVFAATDVPAVNAQVQRDAKAAGIFCCRCDDPSRGDFAGGATGRVGEIILAISTAGASPVLAARIRDNAVAAIDPGLARFVTLQQTWRGSIKTRLKTPEQRRLLLQRIAGEEMLARFRRHGPKGAERLLQRWLRELQAGAAAGGRHGK